MQCDLVRWALALAGSLLIAASAGGDDIAGGFYDRDRASLIDARRGDRAFPVKINNWWGLMNRQGLLIVYPGFDWTDASYQGLSRVVVDGRTGYLRLNGQWQVPPRFPYGDRFKNNYAIIGDGDHFGFIDQRGQVVVPVQLDGALRFRQGFAAVRKNDRIGFIDTSGTMAIAPRFAKARSFHEGLAAVRAWQANGQLGRWGFIDQRGKWQFRDPRGRIQTLGDFSDNLARVEIDGRWGYLNRQFDLEIAPRFQAARDFENNLAAVKVDGRWGYIDRRGRFQISPRFRLADDFASDRAPDRIFAMIGDDLKRGYININASRGIKPQYDQARPFFRGLARVSRAPSFGYIDTTGKLVWDPRDAMRGIRDLTLKGQVEAGLDDWSPGTDTIPLPPKRPARTAPYPPEYQYDPVLPKPAD
jgi:hypothetical protein